MRPRSLSSALLVGLLAAGSLGTAGWLAFDWISDRIGAEQVAIGRKLYAEHCASCHGAKLEGQPDWQTPKPDERMPAPPHDATGHTWHHTDPELFLITKNGMAAVVPGYESDMPAFERVLSDEQIEAVLAFIKSTWPSRERDYQEARSRATPGTVSSERRNQ